MEEMGPGSSEMGSRSHFYLHTFVGMFVYIYTYVCRMEETVCGYRYVDTGMWIEVCGYRYVDTGMWIQVCGYRYVDTGLFVND